MASIEKRSSSYPVKYRDPLGRQHSRSFARRADADRFAREVEVDKDRGGWIDPRDSDLRSSIGPSRGISLTLLQSLTAGASITSCAARKRRMPGSA